MTRAVVVNRDPAAAQAAAAILRRAGYEVELCAGPTADPCPVLRSLPCPLADRADILVYDAWAGGSSDGGRRLIADVRETYPDLPVVLTSVDQQLDWVEVEGTHRVTPIVGPLDEQRLLSAVEVALADQGMAV